jgi:hypothetical protein
VEAGRPNSLNVAQLVSTGWNHLDSSQRHFPRGGLRSATIHKLQVSHADLPRLAT